MNNKRKMKKKSNQIKSNIIKKKVARETSLPIYKVLTIMPVLMT
jgi:hypothetical protein